MSIPIRCFTCNKVIANTWRRYQLLQAEGVSDGDALDEVGLVRYCCRKTYLGHVELDVIALDASAPVQSTMQNMMALHQMPNGPSAKVIRKSDSPSSPMQNKNGMEKEEHYFGEEGDNDTSMDFT